jgi:hypothetical protein
MPRHLYILGALLLGGCAHAPVPVDKLYPGVLIHRSEVSADSLWQICHNATDMQPGRTADACSFNWGNGTCDIFTLHNPQDTPLAVEFRNCFRMKGV